MIVTQQPSTSTTKLEEGIVGVDGTSNQAVNRSDSRFPEYRQAKI